MKTIRDIRPPEAAPATPGDKGDKNKNKGKGKTATEDSDAYSYSYTYTSGSEDEAPHDDKFRERLRAFVSGIEERVQQRRTTPEVAAEHTAPVLPEPVHTEVKREVKREATPEVHESSRVHIAAGVKAYVVDHSKLKSEKKPGLRTGPLRIWNVAAWRW